MKRTFFAIIGLMCCYSVAHAQQLKNLKDSVAYAIGVEMANSIREIDSTVNLEILVKGLNDELARRALISGRDALITMNMYFAKKQAAHQQELLAQAQAKADAYMEQITKQAGVSKTKSGLYYKIEKMGDSKLPQDGDMVTVHYKLTDTEGNIIDSSYDRGEPITFANVEGAMIPGFLEGIRLLGEGGKAILYVPPTLGYGNVNYGDSRLNSLLIFDIALLAVTPKK